MVVKRDNTSACYNNRQTFVVTYTYLPVLRQVGILSATTSTLGNSIASTYTPELVAKEAAIYRYLLR